MNFSTNKMLLGFVIAFIILFLAFFPPMYTSIDEHEYLKNAVLLVSGQLKTADPLDYCGGIIRNSQYQSTYNIGKSVFLIPFLLFPFPFAMLSGLLIHLLNTALFFLILRQRGIDPRFTLLFLFFPAFVWESRTLFSESFALTFLLAGTFFYPGSDSKTGFKKIFLSGLLFGLSAFVRTETVLISLSFAIGLSWAERKKILKPLENPAYFFALGGLVAAILLFGWNSYLYSSPVSTSYGPPTWILSGIGQPLFFSNLLLFVLILLIAYPFMLASLAFSKTLRFELAIAAILTLGLFSQFTNISVFQFFSPLTITGRMRYLIPLAGLLLIPYAETLDGLFKRFFAPSAADNRPYVFLAIGLILFGGALAIHFVHQDLTQKRAMVANQLSEKIPENSLTLGSSDDCIYFLKGIFGNRKYLRIDSDAGDAGKLFETFSGSVYVLDLKYANRSDSDIRQETIDSERQKIKDFIQLHQTGLEQVYHTIVPHDLSIYLKIP